MGTNMHPKELMSYKKRQQIINQGIHDKKISKRMGKGDDSWITGRDANGNEMHMADVERDCGLGIACKIYKFLIRTGVLIIIILIVVSLLYAMV